MTNQDGATQEDAAQDRAPQDSAARDRAAVLARLAAMLGELTADEDLNLDSLANIGTLATFIADRISRR